MMIAGPIYPQISRSSPKPISKPKISKIIDGMMAQFNLPYGVGKMNKRRNVKPSPRKRIPPVSNPETSN